MRFLFLILMLGVGIRVLIASTSPERTDTLTGTKKLEEIVITAPELRHTGDKSTYYPPKGLVDATNNATQALAALQIPDLVINPATGSIEKMGGGTLSIRINDRQASSLDLLTIAPKDIIRVDYIPNPGLKYGNADGVINIIVKRRDTGYGASLNLLQSLNRGWGDYTGSAKYTSGNSEWSIDAHANPMWDMDASRNNTERFILWDGNIINRKEEGIKMPNRLASHRYAMQYSYAHGNKFLLNAQLRISHRNDRNLSKGNITTYNADTIMTDIEHEESSIKSTQFDMDIYMYWKINTKNKVHLNIVPSLIRSSTERIYSTSYNDIQSHISGDGYRWLAEGIWEGRIANGMLTAGIKSLWSRTDAVYSHSADIREQDLNNYAFAEWRQTLGNLQYSIGLGATAYFMKRPVSLHYTNLNPRINLRYAMSEQIAVTFTADSRTIAPTVNQLSPIKQQVDNYQWVKGNPELSPFHQQEARIEIDGIFNNISGKLTVSDTYSHNPVMSAKVYADNIILKSCYNGGHHNDLTIKAQLRTPIFVTRLTLSVEGGWHTTTSRGINYTHRYSQPFVNVQLMWIKGKWWMMLKYNTSYNRLWGEEISSQNSNMTNIGIGYTYKNITFMVGAVNPIGNISLKSRDLSNKAGYDRVYNVASTRHLFWAGITLNLYKGKRRSAPRQKLINNNSYESINTVTK